MSQTVTKPRAKRRTASKQQRQAQLIKATIRSIAKHGLSETTMATVSSEASLSQGIINLHFQSKERLLEETLIHVVSEYRSVWCKAMDSAGDSAYEKLEALAAVDFDKRICQRNKLAVWFAFWGESRSRLTYRKICTESSREYRDVLTGLCEEVIRQGGYKVRAGHVATGLLAMNGGLWLDMLLSPAEMSAQQAQEISLSYLWGVFPAHASS
ncbi:MAG: TetR family transcriptional regulator C-terminal domain-containing protein [Xanthomonadales bacterium]|nr:TetR family transcriptional regulator C-terminal domain-containing protein [Xanthomonadales bacterium]